MKKKLIVMLTVLILIMLFIPTAFAIYDTEENNNIENAQKMELGETIEGAISKKDFDFFSFTLGESGRVTLDVTSYMQYYSLYIYDMNGMQVWYADDNEWNSTVGFRNDIYDIDLESGNYYLKVTGAYSASWEGSSSNNSTGSYMIRTTFTGANATESENNNSASSANLVNLGDNLIGLIGANDIYDFYRFTLSESGRVTLDITSYMEYYCWYLYDVSGKLVTYSDENEWNSTVGFKNDIYDIDLESGNYYLKVTGAYSASWEGSSSYNSTGKYVIKTEFTSSNATEKETNNSIATANAIELNENVIGLIGSNDHFDFYKIIVPKSITVTLDITSYMKYYCLYIYSETGNELWASEDNEWNSTVGYRNDTYRLNISAATYYLKVTGARNASWEGSNNYNSTGIYKFALINSNSSNDPTEPAPTDPTPTEPTPSEPAPSEPAPSEPAPSEPAPSEPAPSEPAPPEFTDVDSGSFYEDAVSWAVENGVTTGMTETTFAPMNECIRAQVVTFLWRAFDCPEPESTDTGFTDVPADAYYAKAVAWAVENGITNGVSESTFGSDQACTRAQVATFLWRAASKPAAASSTNPFTDVAPGEFYYDAVLWAVGEGITNGMSETTFAPATTCNRAQIVTFLHRYMTE